MLGRSPGEGNGYPLPYSCLEKSMDRGAKWVTARGSAESNITEQLTHTDNNRSFTRPAWGENTVFQLIGGGLAPKFSLCDPIDCSPPGLSVHGVSQARILEGAASPFSGRPSRPRHRTCFSCTAGGFFTTGPPGTLFQFIKGFIYNLKSRS